MQTQAMATPTLFQPRPVSTELRDQYLALFSLKPLELDQVKQAGK